MKQAQDLIDASHSVKVATTTFAEMGALWRMRTILVDNTLDVVLDLDAMLAKCEKQLDPVAYGALRRLGYTFHGDLENVPELLSKEPGDDGINGSEDGLLSDFGEVGEP